MTGMNVTWKYSMENFTAGSSPSFLRENLMFIKLANISSNLGSTLNLWEELRQLKINMTMDISASDLHYEYGLYKVIAENEKENNDNNANSITEEDIENAAKMYIYFTTYPRDFWLNVVDIFYYFLINESAQDTLLLISNLVPKSVIEETAKKIQLEVLSDHMGIDLLHVENIESLQKAIKNKSMTGKCVPCSS